MDIDAEKARPGGQAGSAYGVDIALRVELDLVDERRDADVFNKAEAQGNNEENYKASHYLNKAAEQH